MLLALTLAGFRARAWLRETEPRHAPGVGHFPHLEAQAGVVAALRGFLLASDGVSAPAS